MTNDIRKNIMLIESIIFDESFKDAQRLNFLLLLPSEEVYRQIQRAI